MNRFLLFLLIAAFSSILWGQGERNAPPASPNEDDSSTELSLRLRSSDPVGRCSPGGEPRVTMSAASFATFTCDPTRALWVSNSAPPDTRVASVAVTEYSYVQGTNCIPTANPGCNVIHLAQLSGSGTIFKVQAAITPFDGADLISFECDGSSYPGENTNLSTFFMEAFQTTNWKTRNIGSNVAVDGFGSYRDVMVPFTSGCTVDITNNSGSLSQVFAHVQYASGPTPPALTGGTRNHYHMAHDHAVGIAPYAIHTCLDYSAGPGEVESVVSAFAPAYNVPTYLEGDPAFITDSTNNFHFSGTEDFFGSEWYFQSFQDTAVSDEWGSPNAVPSASRVEAFRFFTGPHETYTRIAWTNSVVFNQPNGQAGQAPVAPAPLDHDCLVTFWTVN